jgi:hydrogenase accessory protein HypB
MSTQDLRTNILAKNDTLAEALRARFSESRVQVSNWVSSPGTGKTELLTELLRESRRQGTAGAALVGDCATDNDARRLAESGAPVRQIETESMCHLEADMIASHLDGWDLTELDFLVIENVGNLVCPSAYDLGEGTRVALLSVTEGEDKPVKYPQLFHSADTVVITKIDLAEAVEWDRASALSAIGSVNPNATVIETSARSGQGVRELLTNLLAESAVSKTPEYQEAP